MITHFRQAFTRTQIEITINHIIDTKSGTKLGVKTSFGVIIVSPQQALELLNRSDTNDLYVSLTTLDNPARFDCILLERPIVEKNDLSEYYELEMYPV